VIEKLKELKEQPQSTSTTVSLQEKEDIKIPNKIESSPFSDMHFKQEQEQQPIMESNINNNNHINIEEYDFDYIYQDQLNMILGMGFNDVDKIRNLLNANKGDVNVVINQLFA